MSELKIKIDTLDDIKQLIKITTSYEMDIDVVHNKYVIDAKSVMGILSLALDTPLTIRPISDNQKEIDRLFDELKLWTV